MRNIVAEQIARNTFDGSDAEDQINTRSSHTRYTRGGKQTTSFMHLSHLKILAIHFLSVAPKGGSVRGIFGDFFIYC